MNANVQAGEISRDRFARLIPERPYCTDNPTFGVYVRPRNAAVRRAYIQPNSPWRHPFIAFDIDRERAAFAAEDAGMPCPTFTVVNPGTAHAHLIYELEFPVYVGHSAKADWLLDAVRGGLGCMLNADSAYCGLLVQNPLHPRWWTLETNNRFGLRDLADQIPSNLLKPRKRAGQHWLDARSRNCHLFETVRRIAYADVKSSRSQEEFSEHVLSLCRVYNVYSPPLRESELRSTARSISRWTWQRRDRFGDRKRRGALKFSPLDSGEPRGPAIKLRQALGAEYAREQRTSKIDVAIRDAIEHLRQARVPITIYELCKRAAISRSTLYRRRLVSSARLEIDVSSGALRK